MSCQSDCCQLSIVTGRADCVVGVLCCCSPLSSGHPASCQQVASAPTIAPNERDMCGARSLGRSSKGDTAAMGETVDDSSRA